MKTTHQPHLLRRCSSAGARCGSGHDEDSFPPPAHGASLRAAGLMPLLKSFLWAGAMLPGIAWRKTKSPKAGAQEASYTQEMVQEVFEAPAWKHISRRLDGSISQNTCEPTKISQPGGSRAPTEPSSDPIATFDAFPLRKPDAQRGARSFFHRHGAKALAKDGNKDGAGARLIERVNERRARDVLNVESPKLYSAHGISVRKAEPVKGFAWPMNMPEGEEDTPDYHQPPDVNQNRVFHRIGSTKFLQDKGLSL
ncbi:hypothetical protein T484DRAFT_1902425 [Baffinella frigidus]|nr:hypothetical protein T484DRAFT_1902425 [Cryptophyta sp. CCMP2293]